MFSTRKPSSHSRTHYRSHTRVPSHSSSRGNPRRTRKPLSSTRATRHSYNGHNDCTCKGCRKELGGDNASIEGKRMRYYQDHRRKKDKWASQARKEAAAMDLEVFREKRERFCIFCKDGWTQDRSGNWIRCESCYFVAVQPRKSITGVEESIRRIRKRLADKNRQGVRSDGETDSRDRTYQRDWESEPEDESCSCSDCIERDYRDRTPLYGPENYRDYCGSGWIS